MASLSPQVVNRGHSDAIFPGLEESITVLMSNAAQQKWSRVTRDSDIHNHTPQRCCSLLALFDFLSDTERSTSLLRHHLSEEWLLQKDTDLDRTQVTDR